MTMRQKLLFLFGLAVAPLASRAQANNPLSTTQLRRVAEHCVRKVHPDTIEAIAKQESGLFPYSLSINYPKTEAKHMGFANAEYQLSRQPRTRREAIAWTRWFLQHGHSVSIGLMQVSSEQARQLGITDLSELFDPCVNLAAGAVVLQDSYRGQQPTVQGMEHAFALYNAGSIPIGTDNGYAAGVLAKAPPLTLQSPPESSPLHAN